MTLAETPVVGVPFLDLSTVHAHLRDEILADIADAIDSSAFVNGPAVTAFEADFAAFCDAKLCIGVASGLDALRLGLIAAGIGPGDEVIVPANTFIATAEAVSQAGAAPVLADAREDDYNLDPAAAAAAVSTRTRALMPVHLYGQLADMRALGALAAARGLRLFEDACQAHGAQRDGIRAGAAGLAAAFSFYPGKNLGAMGDAGALVTSDPELDAAVRALREHGQRAKYDHDVIGYTSRMDAIQALVLRRKLAHLGAATEQRRAVARAYGELLTGVGDLRLPPVAAGSQPVWHVYPVRTADPEALAASLSARGIATGRHYPQPVHLSGAYAHLGHGPGDFPVAEALSAELLSLPMFPGMSDAQIDAVAGAVRAHFAG
ncbi:MAG: DegT/DnrJ/EryC1/StrS family aminotransferase [Solirubrobacteraceae bacterium]